MTKYKYNFPELRFNKLPDENDQIVKVLYETSELVETGLSSTLLENVIEETLDVIHSCETLLRIIEHKYNCQINTDEVIKKNEKRGYYKSTAEV